MQVAVIGVKVVETVGAAKFLPNLWPLKVPAGETDAVDVAVVDSTGAPVDLTGGQLLLTVKASPDGIPLLSRQATIASPTTGKGSFPLVVADTLALLGVYVWDVWLTDASGNRYQVVPPSTFQVAPALGQPGQAVTVPASQSPLALGPVGPAGNANVNLTGSAAIDAGALIKVSGNGTYATLGAIDDPSLMVGVAATACGGAGQSLAAQLAPGTVTTMLSDGTGTIANGASVCPSTTVAGRIQAGTINSVGVNVGAPVAATLDAPVSVL